MRIHTWIFWSDCTQMPRVCGPESLVGDSTAPVFTIQCLPSPFLPRTLLIAPKSSMLDCSTLLASTAYGIRVDGEAHKCHQLIPSKESQQGQGLSDCSTYRHRLLFRPPTTDWKEAAQACSHLKEYRLCGLESGTGWKPTDLKNLARVLGPIKTPRPPQQS